MSKITKEDVCPNIETISKKLNEMSLLLLQLHEVQVELCSLGFNLDIEIKQRKGQALSQ